jgi:hypothetical protein
MVIGGEGFDAREDDDRRASAPLAWGQSRRSEFVNTEIDYSQINVCVKRIFSPAKVARSISA